MKLGLKEVQEREMIHVLLDCCLQERAYNPYYAFLGQKLCEYNHSHQVSLCLYVTVLTGFNSTVRCTTPQFESGAFQIYSSASSSAVHVCMVQFYIVFFLENGCTVEPR